MERIVRLSTDIFITSTLIFKQMRQEYGYFLSGGWKIGICLLSSAMIALGVWGAFLPFMHDSFDWLFVFIAMPMGLAMVVFVSYALVDTFKSKLVILEDRIQKRGVFKIKELKLEEIKGYKPFQAGIHIVPKDPRQPTIGISFYYKKANELVGWVEDHYPNLDELAKQTEVQEILQKENFGKNVEERKQKLQRAKKWAKFLNISGLIVAFWNLLFPSPYFIATGSAILFPILVVISLNTYKGLVRLDEKKDTAQPSLLMALVLPSAGLAMRALLDFNILDYQNFWWPMITGTFILLAVLILSSNEFDFRKRSDILSMSAIGLFVGIFVFGSTTIVNCIYDFSAPKVHQAKVISKWISSGKSTTYYLELSPWGPRQLMEEVSVNSYLYEELEVGEMVEVNEKEGLVGISWFFLREQ